MRHHSAVLAMAGTVVVTASLVTGTGPAAAAPGDELWSHTFGTFYADPHDAVYASDGTLYVSGSEEARDYNNMDFGTRAYGPTGEWLWTQVYFGRFDSDGSLDGDYESDMTLGSTEHRVYVTGTTEGKTTGYDWATVAYRTDGTRLWARRYDAPAHRADFAHSIAVSHSTGRIFVVGKSLGVDARFNIRTVAYSANGTKLWSRQPRPLQADRNTWTHVVVAPGGRRLYVAGSCKGPTLDICVLAYRENGALVWHRHLRYAGSGNDIVNQLVLDPDGQQLYLVGERSGDSVTMALDHTGAQLWRDRYDGPGHGVDYATDAAVTQDGQTLYVTGASTGVTTQDAVTIAYDSSGARLWTATFDSAEHDDAGDVAVNLAGTEVYVSTGHDTMTLVAYDTAGNQLWVREDTWDDAESRDVTVKADGTTVAHLGRVEEDGWSGQVIVYSTQ